MVLLHSKKLPLGWEAINFKLSDTEGKEFSLDSFNNKRGLLIVFTCNHCPYAKAAWPLLIDLYKKYNEEIGFLAINPNDSIKYPEDSLEKMKEEKEKWPIPFPYLRDETQKITKKYQAQCTPDPYLFKNDQGRFKLFYHGRINDNWQDPKKVKERNLEEAIEKLLKNDSPPSYQPPSMGCSIKWK